MLWGVLLMLLSCSEEKKGRKIVRWGDSLTAPPLVDKSFKGLLKSMIYGDYSYPAFLQESLGDDYEIINAGVGGEKTDTIRKGTILKTKAMRELRGAYCSIFFIGQNGGYSSTRELIAQLNAMINYSKSKHYIVISHPVPNQVEKNAKEMCMMEDSLGQEFGSSFINLRRYLVSSGLHDAGLVPTDEDIVAVKQGKCPPQLLKDGTHFTKDGYKLIAKLVEDKIKKMNNE